jgi:hypothetical protein
MALERKGLIEKKARIGQRLTLFLFCSLATFRLPRSPALPRSLGC